MNAPKYVTKQSSGLCGCAYCLKIYETKEIVEWVDSDTTAVCPKCSIDAVYEIEDFSSKGILNHLNMSLFGGTKTGYDQR